MLTFFVKTVSMIVGFLIAWMTVLVANSAPIHPGAAALERGDLLSPNPITCTAGTCWDAADKYGYGVCTKGKDIKSYVRGTRLTLAEQTCYKSIYINMEHNSGFALGIIMFWAVFTSKIWERVFSCAINRNVRWITAFALAVDLPSWYYSCKLCFVYINEYLHFAQSSQFFFTVTEMISIIIAAAHLRKSEPIYEQGVAVGIAVCLCHMIQIFLDEQESILAGNRMKIIRDFLLSFGDFALFISYLALLWPLSARKKAAIGRSVLVVLLLLLTIFQLGFADDASWTHFR